MNLFDRDFLTLTDEELAAWREHQRLEVVDNGGRLRLIKSRFRQYSRAVRHHTSLFPNQYLDPVELSNEELLRETLRDFCTILDSSDVTERAVIHFIRSRKAYFIIGGLLKEYYSFGHHEAHLFPEFPLGTSFRVDYLLVGKSSDGWHLVFVELEAPQGQITLASGELAGAFRKGLAQVADWNTWLEAHYGSLAEVFDRCRRGNEALPHEFRLLDKSRIHYVVVAGRRRDFNEKTYRVRRTRAASELLLHYDNITDAAESVIGRSTY